MFKKRSPQIKQVMIKSLNVIAYIIFFLLIISILGYDTMPIISSLGFFSFAFTFGAQTLIKDVLSRFILILDNTIEIGDTVIVDELQGKIEELSLCTFKMRLDNGTLLTVKYGEIKQLGNKSRRYCYAILNISVNYETNIEKATQLIEQAYKNIKQSLNNKILSPIEIRGIDKISGHEIVIQSRIQTIPRAENLIARAFNLEIKKLFDKEGIKMPDNRLLLNNKTD